MYFNAFNVCSDVQEAVMPDGFHVARVVLKTTCLGLVINILWLSV